MVFVNSNKGGEKIVREDNKKRYKKRAGRPRWSNVYEGKCDVRLDKQELEMLQELSDYHEVTKSSVMRKALRDFYKFNTDKQY